VTVAAVTVPHLLLTLGDPAGIGPEVLLKALVGWDDSTCRFTVVGSRAVLEQTYQQFHQQVDLADPAHLDVLDLPLSDPVFAGQPNAGTGAISFAYVATAVAKILAGKADGVVTGPIAKSAWKQAGYDYPGQTELLAGLAEVARYGMAFFARSPHTGWDLRTLLATTHIPLQQVPTVLNPTLLSAKLDLLVQTLESDFGLNQPRIAIAGLNPHSGEQGQLGREEQDWLQPWLEEIRLQYPQVELWGPVPPDTLWVGAGQAWFGNSKGQFSAQAADAYLALYHDQGLIPVKLMAFDRAVNTTIGLPFVRTSPDHGTAFDIAGKGIADATSFRAAIHLAVELASRRGYREIS
jgi:4-hydroxythreonine-4-phosphate dehydrogenase